MPKEKNDEKWQDLWISAKSGIFVALNQIVRV
jgi:hypothetical protein